MIGSGNSPQKHVWRARIVLLSADGVGTMAIQRQTGQGQADDLAMVKGPNSFGRARHGAPVRNTQNIPFRTRRSSSRGTPRGLFGSSGAITPHSKSLNSYPHHPAPPVGKLESEIPRLGNPLYEFVT